MINLREKSQCTGCTACENVCGKHAITMQYDEYGHLYPKVNTNLCVDCGLCDAICPMLHKDEIGRKNEEVTVFATYNKDLEVRNKSTSGGIFSVLAEEVLSEGGIIFAVRFDGNFKIIHDCFENIGEIDNYRGSKYAQSNLSGIFKSIKEQLKSRKVLFVGTPCQVEGLKRYMGKENPNLITCDFICMCISSQKMWEDYLKDYHSHAKIEKITFKDKRSSWHRWNMLIKDTEGEHLMKGSENPFFNSYLNHLSARPSCFVCPYRKINRNSDITIADCWGIDKVHPEFDDDKGCTTLIIQSNQGGKVFENIKSKLAYIKYDINDVVMFNPYIQKKLSQPDNYNLFNDTYSKNGFKKAYEVIYGHHNNIANAIRGVIRKCISLLK